MERQQTQPQDKNTLTNLNDAYRATALIAATLAIGVCVPGTARAAQLMAFSDASPSGLVAETPPSAVFSRELTEKLQGTLDRTLAEGGSVGAAVGISTPLGTWFGASGFSNLGAKTTVTPSDRFPIGSITKTFVATTVLQLVEEEVLSLDDPLDKWLPEEITQHVEYSERITIRQLLNHTSGIYNYTDKLAPDIINTPSLLLRDWTPEELIAYAQEPNDFPPGEKWNYSNTNYILLGMIIEAATGSTVAEEIRDRILDPLGLQDTFFGGEEEISGGHARGYLDINEDGDFSDVIDGVSEDVSELNLSQAWTAGAMVSTTQDLTRFIQALWGGELLLADTLAEMLTVAETGIEGFGYGLGIFSQTIPGVGVIWGHNGGIVAFSSNLWYIPDLDTIYVDLQNSQPPSNIAEPMASILLNTPPEPSALKGLPAIDSESLGPSKLQFQYPDRMR